MANQPQRATHRILDASANRASEGLRTMEEFARFLLDDEVLSQQLKTLRHQLTVALGKISRGSLLMARDTEGDVGTQVQTETEYARADLASVVAAAASRTQQSLRVLEEYGKTLDGSIVTEIEQIRYRCYTVAAELELRIPVDQRRQRLQRSVLYVLIEALDDEDAFCEQVRTLATAGVDVFQLRDHRVDDRTLIRRARAGTAIAREGDSLFIMNDRADLALAADTDGVHVGQEELPAKYAREILGPERLVGVSTHSLEQAQDAVREGADYIGCGPVFTSQTKSFDSFVGTQLLEQVSGELDLPAFAIGGIDETNVSSVIEAGFRRIAVSGAIRHASDPINAVSELRRQLVGTEPTQNVI